MQNAYGGGAVSEGHRIVEVTKTVTQQHRPVLERQISAGQRAKAPAKDRTTMVAGAGLGAAGTGALLSETGHRKIARINQGTKHAAAQASDAAGIGRDARAKAKQAKGTPAGEKRLAHENLRASQADIDHARWSARHETGLNLKAKKVPRIRSRIGAGRSLMVGGGLTTAAALVHNERKRGTVGKADKPVSKPDPPALLPKYHPTSHEDFVRGLQDDPKLHQAAKKFEHHLKEHARTVRQAARDEADKPAATRKKKKKKKAMSKAIGPRLFKPGGASVTRGLLSKPKTTELATRMNAARNPVKPVPVKPTGRSIVDAEPHSALSSRLRQAREGGLPS